MSNRLAIAGALATVLATIANAAISIALRSIVDPSSEFMPLGLPSVIGLTIAGGVAATIVYGYILGRSPNPRSRFVQIAVVALLLSFIPDVALLAGFGPAQNATLERVLSLMAMHVVAALIIVTTLLRMAPTAD